MKDARLLTQTLENRDKGAGGGDRGREKTM